MRFPLFLAILLYILIYIVRWQQGGWEIELDLFVDFRNSLDSRIESLLPSPQAQLLSGILLGEKKDLPGPFRLALRDTSTIHMVVVSGQNLSMVAAFFWSLSGLLKRKTALSLSLIAIIFYTILTGAQIPVLRAAVMVFFASLAQMLGRQKDSFWILLITASLLLLINPKWILDLSFQLSFLATIGVVVVAPIFLQFLKHLPLIGADLSVTLAAQLMVLPIIAQNFHQLSLVGVFANLLVLWTIPFIMILGAITLILGSFGAFVVNILLTYFIYIVEFFASLPFSWEYIGEKVWIVWLGYYLILIGALMALKKKWYD